VPDIFLGFEKPSSAIDRCHSLSSLHLSQAALASLPDNAKDRRKNLRLMQEEKRKGKMKN